MLHFIPDLCSLDNRNLHCSKETSSCPDIEQGKSPKVTTLFLPWLVGDCTQAGITLLTTILFSQKSGVKCSLVLGKGISQKPDVYEL